MQLLQLARFELFIIQAHTVGRGRRQLIGDGNKTDEGGSREIKVRDAGEQGTGSGRF